MRAAHSLWDLSAVEYSKPSGVIPPRERAALANVVRHALACRRERCDPACPGWAIFDEYRLLKCDDCCSWLEEDHGWKLWDNDVAALPEARAELYSYLRTGRPRGSDFVR